MQLRLTQLHFLTLFRVLKHYYLVFLKHYFFNLAGKKLLVFPLLVSDQHLEILGLLRLDHCLRASATRLLRRAVNRHLLSPRRRTAVRLRPLLADLRQPRAHGKLRPAPDVEPLVYVHIRALLEQDVGVFVTDHDVVTFLLEFEGVVSIAFQRLLVFLHLLDVFLYQFLDHFAPCGLQLLGALEVVRVLGLFQI